MTETAEAVRAALAGKTKDEIVALLLAKIAEIRARMGQKIDADGPRVVEKIVLKKMPYTPLPGEPEPEPIETVIIEANGEVIIIPGRGQEDSAP